MRTYSHTVPPCLLRQPLCKEILVAGSRFRKFLHKEINYQCKYRHDMVNYLSLIYIPSDVPGYTWLLPVHISCIINDFVLFKLFVLIWNFLSSLICLYRIDHRYNTFLSLLQLGISFLRLDFRFIFGLVGVNVQKVQSKYRPGFEKHFSQGSKRIFSHNQMNILLNPCDW
jgi:hypothetical protein